MTRCRWCGRTEQSATDGQSTHCNPPFTVQRHKFDGRHPADLQEAAMGSRPEGTYTQPIFRDHNCGGCDSGAKPCLEGNYNNCSNPRARND